MAYLRKPASTRRVGGTGGRFGEGLSNPNYGSVNTNTYGGTDPSNVSYGSGLPEWRADPNWRGKHDPTPRHRSYTQGPQRQSAPGWLQALRRKTEQAEFNGPDIPGWSEWEGQSYSPSSTYQDVDVDVRGAIAANEALLREKMEGEFAGAGKHFGKLGILASGGGLGAGYSGTLGESARGFGRDLAEVTNRYDVDAQMFEANMREQARQADLMREFEDFQRQEQQRYGAWGSKQDYDWTKYGAEYENALKEQEDSQKKYQQLLMLYGM